MIPVGYNQSVKEAADSILEKTIAEYQAHVNPGLAKLMSFAGYGVEMRAEGCYLFDHAGNRYLDFLGGYGVFSIGHRHPKAIEAAKRALDTMPLSSKVFFSAPLADLATKLAEITPTPLEYTFFCNSGTEAVEGVLKLAKGFEGRGKIVATVGGYHGKTLGALSTTGREKYREPFYPLLSEIVFVPFNDLEAMTRVVDEATAAVIVEAVQGEGGIHVADNGYLLGIRAACDRTGALLILDEVQTGFGRTGRMFGMDHSGVVPDLITFAKSLGGGIVPIGAFMGTAQVWEKTFDVNPLIHTSTFGGNPLACCVGLATIDVIISEGLVDRAREMGGLLLDGLKKIQQRYSTLVSEVRGVGLMIGVEFSMDDVAELAIAQMVKRGVVAAFTLNNPRVIRFEPPLIINESEINTALTVFDESLAETSELLSAVMN